MSNSIDHLFLNYLTIKSLQFICQAVQIEASLQYARKEIRLERSQLRFTLKIYSSATLVRLLLYKF